MERLLYNIAALDTSVTIETQLKIAPETIPLDIIGTVILKNVFIFDEPKLRAASSMLIDICISVAVAERVVYGSRLIITAIIITVRVPVSTIGLCNQRDCDNGAGHDIRQHRNGIDQMIERIGTAYDKI